METIKCVIVGSGGVGKTCLLMSYSTYKFQGDHIPTILDNYAVTVMIGDEPFSLQLYDTAGQADYDSLRPLSYPQTDVFLVCFSVADPASFDNVKNKWVPEIKHYCPTAPFLLVGTKIDIRNEQSALTNVSKNQRVPTTLEQGKILAEEVKAVKYMECSALTQRGVKSVFDEAIVAALEPSPSTKRNPACSIV